MSSTAGVVGFAPAIAKAPVQMFVSRFSLVSEAWELLRKMTSSRSESVFQEAIERSTPAIASVTPSLHQLSAGVTRFIDSAST